MLIPLLPVGAFAVHTITISTWSPRRVSLKRGAVRVTPAFGQRRQLWTVSAICRRQLEAIACARVEYVKIIINTHRHNSDRCKLLSDFIDASFLPLARSPSVYTGFVRVIYGGGVKLGDSTALEAFTWHRQLYTVRSGPRYVESYSRCMIPDYRTLSSRERLYHLVRWMSHSNLLPLTQSLILACVAFSASR